MLPPVLENLHERKIKKLSDDLPDSCACCSNGKGENSAIESTCCGCFTINALISDQLESCQRLKLKAVKMEQEQFDNDDKLTELEETEVVYFSPETLENILSKQILLRMDNRLIGVVMDESHCAVSLISVCPCLMS